MTGWTRSLQDAASAAAGAAEHALVHVLLRQADLPALQSHNRRNRHSLHDEARNWLNWLTRQDPDESVDLTDLWPNWRAYIAMHTGSRKKPIVPVCTHVCVRMCVYVDMHVCVLCMPMCAWNSPRRQTLTLGMQRSSLLICQT